MDLHLSAVIQWTRKIENQKKNGLWMINEGEFLNKYKGLFSVITFRHAIDS